MESGGLVTRAGIAVGAVAPTVVFCKEAAGFLTNRNINTLAEDERSRFVELMQQPASPIDDLRASSWYRREVLFNAAKSIFE